MATKVVRIEKTKFKDVVVDVRWERTLSIAPYEPERLEIKMSATLESFRGSAQDFAEAAEELAEAVTEVGLRVVNVRLEELGRVGMPDNADAPPDPLVE